MPAEIEVDLYSGAPNPRFLLSEADTAELRRRLADLPPLQPDTGRIRDGLGYRGVRVVLPDGSGDAVVSGGVVEIRGGPGGLTRRSDPGRGLERWLVEAGAGALPPQVTDAVRADLAR